MSFLNGINASVMQMSRHLGSVVLPGRNGRDAGILVCRASDGQVFGAYQSLCRESCDRRSFIWSSPEQVQASLEQLPQGCRIVALLPKSHYLTRTLETPAVSPEETASMLALEAEAALPAEFGEAEISYRLLPAQGDGSLTCKYELYIARSDELKRYLSCLADFGIQIDQILPSALVWGRVLDLDEALDMMVVGSERDGLREAASTQPDGSLSVRTLSESANENSSGTSNQALTEFIRSSMARDNFQEKALAVGWVDGQVPTGSSDGKVMFRTLDYLPQEIHQDAPASKGGENIVSLAAEVLSQAGDSYDSSLSRANLLPRQLLHGRSWKAVLQKTITGAAAMLMGLLIVFIALRVLTVRYKSLAGELSAKTAIIEAEGEAIGWRIEQIKSLNAAISTQGRFVDLIAGLYEATPEGVTYSSVDFSNTGDIRLQGQAKSMALPFLLPQRFEAQKCFENVSLRDAGQVKRTGGSIAEFRLEARQAGSGGVR